MASDYSPIFEWTKFEKMCAFRVTNAPLGEPSIIGHCLVRSEGGWRWHVSAAASGHSSTDGGKAPDQAAAIAACEAAAKHLAKVFPSAGALAVDQMLARKKSRLVRKR